MMKLKFPKDTITKNSILTLILGLGIFLILVGIFALAKNSGNINFLISSIMGLGIILVVLRIYAVSELTIGLPYFLAGIFAILGLAPILAKHATMTINVGGEAPIRILPIIPLYLSLLVFSALTKYHKKVMKEESWTEKNREIWNLHNKGYVMYVDAIVIVSTATLFYLGFTRLIGIEPWTVSGWWQEGFYAALTFMTYAIHQKEDLYYHSWGHWFGYLSLTIGGAFLVTYPIIKVVLENNTDKIIPFFGAIFNMLLGLFLIYYAQRSFFLEPEKRLYLVPKLYSETTHSKTEHKA